MSLFDKVEVPRKPMIIFFVVDTSENMGGEKSVCVNMAIKKIFSEICATFDKPDYSHAQIKIAVLEYSTYTRWQYPQPIEVNDIVHPPLLIEASGNASFGQMFNALNEKLTLKSDGFLSNFIYAPIVIFFSNGKSNDGHKDHLSKLKSNNWFKCSTKIAIAIGEDANIDLLSELTGAMDNVIEVQNVCCLSNTILRLIMKNIKFVDVHINEPIDINEVIEYTPINNTTEQYDDDDLW